MQTIIELLERNESPHENGITTYDRRGNAVERRTYPEITARARAMATSLLSTGLKPGDPLFLQLPNSMRLIECVLGALIAGIRPCCLAPPRALGGMDVFQERVRLLQEHFPGARFLATANVVEAGGDSFSTPPELDENGELAPLSPAEPGSLAFFQLTSGSTKAPKAVRISHGAAVANVSAITEIGKFDPAVDVAVSWLPMYHDMGLIGILFCALYSRHELHFLQPDTFLARPLRWLELLSEVEGRSMTTAPNAAYQSCVQRVSKEQAASLDLSRLRIAGCGAERVRPETLAAFADHFAVAGFREESFVACYGLAEATLAVTFGAGGRKLPVDGQHVSCGFTIPGVQVMIRDEQANPLPDGEQGEITVSSPSLCSGYVGAENPDPFRDGWLHTGDRGYLRGGELYVTGRYKDLIIIDGVNYDPDEFETIGENAVDVYGARSGAFSVERDGREAIILVNESSPREEAQFEECARVIGERVASLFGFNVDEVIFVRRGCLKKTSSGKVARSDLKRAYHEEQLDVLWQQES